MVKKILVVDDSALMRKILSDIIATDDRFMISDTAVNGLEAYDLLLTNKNKYDLMILDLNMPKMSGLQLMERMNMLPSRPVVVVVSTLAREGANETIRSLELGAFDFVTKPDSFVESKGAAFRKKILDTLALAAKFTVAEVKERPSSHEEMKPVEPETFPRKHVKQQTERRGGNVLVALACSTGGPKALQSVVPKLPAGLAAPVVIVQHMPEGFTASLASRLNEISQLNVKEAEEGDILRRGTVYIAKGGFQMRLKKQGADTVITLSDEPPRHGLRPCADIMYESLNFTDYNSITCVVLTGMGNDGSAGIRQLEDAKNIYVIAQDEASSIVYGMPRVIKEQGLTDEVVDLRGIADAITRNVGVQQYGC